jgi:transposase InsO family protein
MALFRLSVLGPLASCGELAHGELKPLIQELAEREHDIPGTGRQRIAEKTIEGWYYTYRREGLEGLVPKTRSDFGKSKLSQAVQDAILAAKRENPCRSLDQLVFFIETTGLVAKGTVPRSSVHRLLQSHGISRPTGAASLPEEYRSYEALYAGDIWYGDVMHGPRVLVKGRLRKVYLVSLMDDASRLLAHSAFCTGEKALDIEGVLKQAVLKRGLPIKLVVDNGAAYRSKSLQGICARLGIHLIYCRPYAPEGKAKLERWHRTFRQQFITELDLTCIHDLADLNARLWAWIDEIYHKRSHRGLEGITPLARYQQDLPRIRQLGQRATVLDALFYHRVSRKVRKDGSVSYDGLRYEVPYELSGLKVWLVVDPHTREAFSVEDDDGKLLGEVIPQDLIANNHRRRRKPGVQAEGIQAMSQGNSLVEIAYQKHYAIDEAATAETPAEQTTGDTDATNTTDDEEK